MELRFQLNDEEVETEISTETLLVDVIRGLGLTGTKECCGVGVCGACTVLVRGLPVSSCIYLAACAEGAEVWTVEGLTRTDEALVDAFVENEGMQCGICTPGQVVSTYALAREHPEATDDEITTFMSGNLCRCTGYQSIKASVKAYLATR